LINYSFVEAQWERDFCGTEEPIRVLNPIAAQFSVMRTSLIGGLVAALKYNLNRKAGRVRIFELGRVFERDAAAAAGPLAVRGIRQSTRLGALAYGPAADEQWGMATRDVDFFDVKGDFEGLLAGGALRLQAAAHPAFHPGRSAQVSLRGEPVGWIGELHPRWQQKYELPRAPVIFEVEIEPLLLTRVPLAAAVPRFPEVQRDIALWFEESVPLQDIYDVVGDLVQADPRLSCLRQFRLFDLYRPSVRGSSKIEEVGANALLSKEKSLAFRLLLQDTERTLSEARAEAAVAAIIEGLSTRLNARLRQ